MREIRVTRQDFGELKGVVKELAGAQKRTEVKVEDLAEAQKKTEIALQGLATEVGALSQDFGFGLEDIADVVLPGCLKPHHRIDMGEFERKFFEVNGKLVEINASFPERHTSSFSVVVAALGQQEGRA